LLGALLVWSCRGFKRGSMPRGLPRRLGRMKGLPQKLGQFLAYTSRGLDDFTFLQVEGVALPPEETRRAFGERLARFDDAELVPISAASICQVHRARIGAENVVVKLPYPGIERALTLDFRVARTGLALLALPLPRVLADPLRRGRRYLDLLEPEMRGECDLAREAATIEAFTRFLAAATFPEARFLSLPELRRDRSDARALVLARADGEPADRFLARHPRRKNRFRQLLFAFHFHSLRELGRLHSDPHPGNFLCREIDSDLHVTLLDFGCAKSFSPEVRAALFGLVDAVAAWEDAAVRARALELGFLPADLEALGVQLLLFLEVILAPFLAARRGAEFDWDEWRLEYKLNMLASSRSASYAFTLPEPLLLLLRVLAAFDRYR
jgi:predicted unusual protein kinase regulating ubiquinone biosynthesis (AarF/ABC1/UbiB family)